MKDRVYTFHIDPGHGWLAVPYKDVLALGIEKQISTCSYQTETMVYLEEDCDAPRFDDAFEKVYGHRPNYTHVYHKNRSIIRSYNHYNPSITFATI